MSHTLPRAIPRWSEGIAAPLLIGYSVLTEPVVKVQSVAALAALLPSSRARVCVGPPLLRSIVSRFVGAPNVPVQVPSDRFLVPLTLPQSPPVLPANRLLRTCVPLPKM